MKPAAMFVNLLVILASSVILSHATIIPPPPLGGILRSQAKPASSVSPASSRPLTLDLASLVARHRELVRQGQVLMSPYARAIVPPLITVNNHMSAVAAALPGLLAAKGTMIGHVMAGPLRIGTAQMNTVLHRMLAPAPLLTAPALPALTVPELSPLLVAPSALAPPALPIPGLAGVDTNHIISVPFTMFTSGLAQALGAYERGNFNMQSFIQNQIDQWKAVQGQIGANLVKNGEALLDRAIIAKTTFQKKFMPNGTFVVLIPMNGGKIQIKPLTPKRQEIPTQFVDLATNATSDLVNNETNYAHNETKVGDVDDTTVAEDTKVEDTSSTTKIVTTIKPETSPPVEPVVTTTSIAEKEPETQNKKTETVKQEDSFFGSFGSFWDSSEEREEKEEASNVEKDEAKSEEQVVMNYSEPSKINSIINTTQASQQVIDEVVTINPSRDLENQVISYAEPTIGQVAGQTDQQIQAVVTQSIENNQNVLNTADVVQDTPVKLEATTMAPSTTQIVAKAIPSQLITEKPVLEDKSENNQPQPESIVDVSPSMFVNSPQPSPMYTTLEAEKGLLDPIVIKPATIKEEDVMIV